MPRAPLDRDLVSFVDQGRNLLLNVACEIENQVKDKSRPEAEMGVFISDRLSSSTPFRHAVHLEMDVSDTAL